MASNFALKPNDWRGQMAAGATHAKAGRFQQAAPHFRLAVKADPKNLRGWQALGITEHQLGNWPAANAAHLKLAEMNAQDPKLRAMAEAARQNRPQDAHRMLAERLKESPNDILALMIAADLARRAARPAETVKILYRVVDLAPGFQPAWPMLAATLGQLPAAEGLARARAEAARRPDVEAHQTIVASALERTLDFREALTMLDGFRAKRPDVPQAWIASGHLRKTLGDAEGAADAYREALRLAPRSGEAWWALADMKGHRFTPQDRAAMETLATDTKLAGGERIMLFFALGRARELDGEAESAFAAYAEGNALRKKMLPPIPDEFGAELDALRQAMTPEWLARDTGADGSEPIFIVGLPRSGSTLVEQILASHPAVEATMELHELPNLMREVAVELRRPWPALLGELSPEKLHEMGEAYLARTRALRKTDRPRFIDKLPANFRNVGLIRAMLPNAKVIDVRRAPEACGWSIFRQHFAGGHAFAWDLADIGNWYRFYAATMELWDEKLPGFVHHLSYEELVEQPEPVVRALLDFLGLPFDPACLDFHKTDRPVRTPSGDQVRQPLNRRGLEDWKPFAAHLEPLRKAVAG